MYHKAEGKEETGFWIIFSIRRVSSEKMIPNWARKYGRFEKLRVGLECAFEGVMR